MEFENAKMLMKKYFFLIVSLICFNNALNSQQTKIQIIPQPDFISIEDGTFILNEKSSIKYDLNGMGQMDIKPFIMTMQLISSEFNLGFDKEIKEDTLLGQSSENSIHFDLDANIQNDEGYEIHIKPNKITCKAKTSAGWLYAWQSLKQIFPLEIYSAEIKVKMPVELPCVRIKDQPRFEYRGLHLDVCRHFFSIDEVKKYIDLLAIHKMNRFHWHLTDDQGWRIEIKKYPELTKTAAFRDETLIGHYSDQPHQFDGTKYGGFYTQDEIRDVVRYAAQKNITVIPEIEMPGHASAALAAYPELACTSGPFKVETKWGVFEDVFCPTEETFSFLENVLIEVLDLFPGKYIHIGGDECPKTAWENSTFCQQLMKEEGLKDEHELQSYFIGRIGKFLQSKGRKLIGWDEILEGGLSDGAAVMAWRSFQSGADAAKMGHEVVMTPGSHCYFDYYQSDHPAEPIAIGGFIPLEKVYHFEPVPDELSVEEAKFILGAQANVWTEYIGSFDQVEYMAYPRACALAEVLWSKADHKDFTRFSNNLVLHQKRLDQLKVNFSRQLFDTDLRVINENGSGVYFQLSKKIENGDILYTLDGSEPNANSKKYLKKIEIKKDVIIRAASFEDGIQIGREITEEAKMHIAFGKKVALTEKASPKYNTGGLDALTNGVGGQNSRYGDKEWLGFEGTDFNATIDLGSKTKFNSFSTRFYHGPGQWIYAPGKVTVYAGDSPANLKMVKSQEFDPLKKSKAVEFTMSFTRVNARYVKIYVENYGLIPDGMQGAGYRAWLFVDELILQ